MRLQAISVGIGVVHNHFNGFIHSVFHHACNISIDNQSLITLLSSSLGNLPQGIRLDTPSDFTFERPGGRPLRRPAPCPVGHCDPGAVV